MSATKPLLFALFTSAFASISARGAQIVTVAAGLHEWRPSVVVGLLLVGPRLDQCAAHSSWPFWQASMSAVTVNLMM